MVVDFTLYDSINDNLIAYTKSGIMENFHFSKMCRSLYKFAPEGLKPRLSVRIGFDDHVVYVTLKEFVELKICSMIVKQFNHFRLKFPVRELVEFLDFFGWDCHEEKAGDFPYNTKFWVLTPRDGEHKNSDCVRKFLYACDYTDIDVDYNKKQIIVNV